MLMQEELLRLAHRSIVEVAGAELHRRKFEGPCFETWLLWAWCAYVLACGTVLRVLSSFSSLAEALAYEVARGSVRERLPTVADSGPVILPPLVTAYTMIAWRLQANDIHLSECVCVLLNYMFSQPMC
jgi:hypothetical protein